MEIKYLKGTLHYGDCYVNEKDIISISKDEIKINPKREEALWGYYQRIFIKEEDFQKLINAAETGEREKGISILTKIHQDNPNLENNRIDFYGKLPKRFDEDAVLDLYLKTEPILK